MRTVRPAPFASEELEPFAVRVIGIAASRYVALKARGDYERWEMEDALRCLWWALKGIEKITIALRSGRDCSDSSGVHFSMASTNESSRVYRMIWEELGIDAHKEPGWD